MNLEDPSLKKLFRDVIRERRSVRSWKKMPVSDELILECLELATWAPNSGNRQTYKIVVIRDRRLIQAIADVVQEKTERMASWPEANPFRDTVDRWKTATDFFRGAPVCVAFFMGQYQSTADMLLAARAPYDAEAQRMYESRRIACSSLQTMGALIDHFLLILHAHGLGGCWMTGPVQAKREIESLVGKPKGMDFVALVPVGYPDIFPPAPGRKSVGSLIEFR